MTEREIGKLRKKILLISTLSFFGVMLLMGGMIYFFSTITIRNEARQIMNYIARNDGDLLFSDEDIENIQKAAVDYISSYVDENGTYDDKMSWSLDNIFGTGSYFDVTPDSSYTTRYFAVLFDSSDNVESVKTAHIGFIDEDQATEYALAALEKNRSFGNFGRYYYHVSERESGGTIVIYLDRSTQITSTRRILVFGLMILAAGTLLAFFLMRVFSKKFVKTELENVEKQKAFITNASHELKTPLAVIRANTEMTEMLDGESEWTASTLRQVDRMNGLIQNLVMIARSQEKDGMDIREMNISPSVRESAKAFTSVASGSGKKLLLEIEDPVNVKADESRVRQLVSLLTDNAVKYCDEGGEIKVSLSKSGRGCVLCVSNDYAEGKDVDYSRFFERFYREDAARTIEASDEGKKKSGYGVGLSIADGLAKSMKGSLNVGWKDGVISFSLKL